jgi:hypothetical protein
LVKRLGPLRNTAISARRALTAEQNTAFSSQEMESLAHELPIEQARSAES